MVSWNIIVSQDQLCLEDSVEDVLGLSSGCLLVCIYCESLLTTKQYQYGEGIDIGGYQQKFDTLWGLEEVCLS